MDEDIQSNNTCLPLCTKTKRFKQDEYFKDHIPGHIVPKAKNTKLKYKNRNKNVSTYRCLKKSSNDTYNEVNRNLLKCIKIYTRHFLPK